MRRKASPPRRPRVYQRRCLRSSRTAARSAGEVRRSGGEGGEGGPAPPPARVPEKVLAQLAARRAFRLLGTQLHVRMSAVVPIRAGPRSAFRPHETVPPELVLYRHVD